MNINPHRIEITTDPSGKVNAQFTCSASIWASCHHWEGRNRDRCIILNWIDGETFDCYVGMEAPTRSGPVIFHWEDYYYTWEYEDEEE